jgi:hypothetical protein
VTEHNVPVPARICADCSRCCEGWLQGSTYGKPFWKGRPCHFLDGGKCSIYGNHPQDPWKSFKCVWLVNPDIPGWMRPNEVNAILVWRKKGNFDYLDLSEAGEKLRAEVLSWAVMYCLHNNFNLQYMIDGGLNRIGSREFLNQNW